MTSATCWTHSKKRDSWGRSSSKQASKQEQLVPHQAGHGEEEQQQQHQQQSQGEQLQQHQQAPDNRASISAGISDEASEGQHSGIEGTSADSGGQTVIKAIGTGVIVRGGRQVVTVQHNLSRTEVGSALHAVRPASVGNHKLLLTLKVQHACKDPDYAVLSVEKVVRAKDMQQIDLSGCGMILFDGDRSTPRQPTVLKPAVDTLTLRQPIILTTALGRSKLRQSNVQRPQDSSGQVNTKAASHRSLRRCLRAVLCLSCIKWRTGWEGQEKTNVAAEVLKVESR